MRAAVVFALALAAGGAAAEVRLALSLAQALDMARNANPDYVALGHAVELAEVDLAAAQSVFRPHLTSRFDSSDRTGVELGSHYEIGLTRLSPNGSRWGIGVSNAVYGRRSLSELKVSYRLPFFGDPAAGSRFALMRAEIESERRQGVLALGRRELEADVIDAYYGVVLAAHRVELANGAAALSRRLAAATFARARAGTASAHDTRSARHHVASADNLVRTQTMRLARDTAHLAATVGIFDTHVELTATDPIPIPARHPLVVSPDNIAAQAFASRPDLEAARREIELLERKSRSQARRALPPVNVDLYVSMVGTGDSFGDSWAHHEPRFGVDFNMALNQGRDGNLDRRRTAVQLTAARNAYRAQAQRIHHEVADLVAMLEERAGEVTLSREAVTLAEEAYRIGYLRHRAGTLATEQLLDSAQALKNARHRALECRVGYWMALRRLEALTGLNAAEWTPES